MQYLVGAAAVVALVLGALAVFGGGPEAAGEPLELSLGEANSLSSCIVITPEILAAAPLAFAGTATSVEGETVTLTVDEWYVGGDATTVELHAPNGFQALIGGIDFVEGESYLVSAESGTVNYCGMSGEATPELQALYDEAFAG